MSKVKELQKETKEATKKKLFLTDGWQVPCTGICIYMFRYLLYFFILINVVKTTFYFLYLFLRINLSKQLPEEGFQKDLYTGIIDTMKIGIVPSIQRVVENVFMEALAHSIGEGEDDCPMIKTLLLPGLRSFCSALKGNDFFFLFRQLFKYI